MHLDDTIPKVNKVAILLIIAFVLNLLFSTLLTPFLTAFLGMEDYAQYKMSVSTATIINLMFGYILNIIIAVWTYREAKKQNERPWIWTAFSLFFGLIAVIAFYLILVIRELRTLRMEIKTNEKQRDI
jgi:O-antigen/teichoic acid export membrane protein